jgi:hypothetical protein
MILSEYLQKRKVVSLNLPVLYSNSQLVIQSTIGSLICDEQLFLSFIWLTPRLL